MSRNVLKDFSELPFFGYYYNFITEMFETPKNCILERLKNNSFSESMIKLVNGFSKDNYTCSYYQEEGINDLSKKHSANSLKVFHNNIASFGKNSTELISNLECLKFYFDVICLTEVRKTSIGIINMVFNDYHVFLDNPDTAKGGVALMVRQNKFNNITELCPSTGFDLKNKCDCIQCKIENKWLRFNINGQSVIVGGIYRHPNGNIQHFNDALKNTINQIHDDTLAIILGDININLLSESDERVQCYLNNYLEKSFIPCITLPTRITDYSATIIDHIFLKCPRKLLQNKCSSGNLIFDISDHLPNFMFFNIDVPSIKDRPYIRLFTEKRKKLFLDNLMNEPSLINENDLDEVNNSYDIFSTNYLNLFNKYFPYVRQSRTSYNNKPYITSGIKVSIKNRNKLYNKYLNNKNETNKSIWRKFRNKTRTIITRSQEMYYNKLLKSNQNSSRQLWSTFGKILNNNKQNKRKIGSLNVNGDKISDPQTITDSFNNFFSKIGDNLAAKFAGNNTNEFKKYLGSPANQSMLLYKISHSEIKNAIKNLKNSNSSGEDEITSDFVKLSAPVLIPALHAILNLSLSTGVYPHKLKIAKVVPIHKKGDSTSMNNYRPISILSTINKIFEKILHARLIKYIDDFNILYKYQFGFRKNHSTELALIEIVDQIRMSLNKGDMSCGIFIDLSKAFDTVNHEILIDKLHHYGIRGKALDLFKSYLGNRQQFASIDKFKSNTRPINCGVPQGSVLGPLFFILFINDLPKCCPQGNFRIFADDTNVFIHGKTIKELTDACSEIMTALSAWFLSNKLTLNAEKSSFTIFKSPRRIIDLPNSISYLNQKLNRVSYIKFLGVTLDENLSFNLHINEVCNKLKNLFHVFYSIRGFLSKENIRTLYYALIYSRIKYGIAVYGQAKASNIKRIQTLQNKLLKVLAGKKYRYPTDKLHNEFDLLKVSDITNQEVLTFVYNFFSNGLPGIFNNYYQTFSENHSYNTRNAGLSIRKIRKNNEFGAKSIKIKGSDLWNNLNNSIKVVLNTKQFRYDYKKSILPYNSNG